MKRTINLSAALVLLSFCSSGPALAQSGSGGNDAFFDDSSELVLGSFRVVAERTVDAGRSEVDIAADLTNVGPAVWFNAVATLVPSGQETEIVQGELHFSSVPLTGSVSSDDTWTLSVPSERVATLTRELVERTIRFRVIGVEITVYAGNTFILDEETDEEFDGWIAAGPGGYIYFFRSETPLLEAIDVGDIFVEDPNPTGYRSENGMSKLLPRKVIAKNIRPSGRVRLDCEPLVGTDYVSGSFDVGIEYGDKLGETFDLVDFYDFRIGCPGAADPRDPGSEETAPSCEFRGIPLRFNDLEITTGLKASGEIRFGAGIADLQLRFRNLLPSRLVVDLQVSYSASFEIRAEAGARVPKTEKTLFSVELPIFTANIGGAPVEISLDLKFLVGAKADLRAAGVTSVSQNSKLGVRFGFADGDMILDTYQSNAPLDFTPPYLEDTTGLDLKGWAGVDATLLVDRVRGPFVKTTGYGLFTVEPLEERAWEIEAGIDLEAGVHAGFHVKILGFKIGFKKKKSKKWNFPLATFPPLPEDVRGLKSGRGGAFEELASVRDANARWASTLRDTNGVSGDPRIHALANGDSLVVVRGSGEIGHLIRVDLEGDVIWQRRLGYTYLLDAEELPGGRIFAGGYQGHRVWVGEFDGDGNEIWSRAYELDETWSPKDFTAAATADGEVSLYIVGYVAHGSTSDRNLCVFRFDDTGWLLWANEYGAQAEVVLDAQALPEGGLLLAGKADYKMPGETQWLLNGLVLRIDRDGSVVWKTAINSYRSGTFHSVGVGPDGRVWATGIVPRSLAETYPAVWVAQLDFETGEGDHVLLGLDEQWESELDSGPVSEQEPWAGQSGDFTGNDAGLAIVPLQSGAVLAGSIGSSPNKAAIAMRLDSDLGVQWMTTFDGARDDVFSGLAVAGDGILVAGTSKSFFGLDTPGGITAVLVQKLPFDGLLDYESSRGIITRYSQPQSKVAVDLEDEHFSQTLVLEGTDEVPVYGIVPLSLTEESISLTPSESVLEAEQVGAIRGRAFYEEDESEEASREEAPDQEPLIEEPSNEESPSEDTPDGQDPVSAEPRFVRGDGNGDGVVDVSDIMSRLDALFGDGAEPDCPAACDANADGASDVSDVLFLMSFLFAGGPAPEAPFPGCGVGAVPVTPGECARGFCTPGE